MLLNMSLPRAGTRFAATVLASAVMAGSALAQDVPAIGTTHEGDLKIPGWEDRGGGQLNGPIWYSLFRRPDGAFRAIINRSLGYLRGSKYMTFRVTDVLTTIPYPEEMDFLFVCQSPRAAKPGAVIAVVRIDMKNEKEWWTDIRRAWTVSIDTGRSSETDTRGVRCLNEGWGR
jgi:hypothetical protein